MSKIGKKPVQFDSSKVTITAEKGGDFNYLVVKVKGPKGELEQSVRRGVKIEVTDKEVIVTRDNDSKENKAFHGLYRSLIENMIVGVLEGYEKKLEIHGVGYRGTQVGQGIELNVGFTHSVKYEPPMGVEVKMEDQNTILVSGIDKTKVGQTAAEIKAIRKPEPYKGKGIRYAGEQIRRKAGKTGAAV